MNDRERNIHVLEGMLMQKRTRIKDTEMFLRGDVVGVDWFDELRSQAQALEAAIEALKHKPRE